MAFNNIYAQHRMKHGLLAGTSEHGQLTKGAPDEQSFTMSRAGQMYKLRVEM
jgi:hypothetical protein